MNGFANFYPCIPGKFSHDNWTCDGNGSSDDNCDSTTFKFDPGSLFVPEVKAVMATSTVTMTSTATGTASAPTNETSCPAHNGLVIGVGVGLGVTLELSAIAALFGYFVERRKRKAAEKIASEAQASSYDPRNLQEYSNGKTVHEAGSQALHEIGQSHRPP